MGTNRVVLIHGNGDSSGRDNWFPYIRDALTGQGIECLTPDMPDPARALSAEWLPHLAALGCDDNTVLVGHSSGAVAAMRYAEQHRILGSILVGTYHTDLGMDDERASGYFDTPWNWAQIKHNQRWIAIFASVDDPYIDIVEPRHIRDQLSAEYHEYTDRGHFSSGDPDEHRFPELLELLTRKLAE